jgi:hypothetical protein
MAHLLSPLVAPDKGLGAHPFTMHRSSEVLMSQAHNHELFFAKYPLWSLFSA